MNDLIVKVYNTKPNLVEGRDVTMETTDLFEKDENHPPSSPQKKRARERKGESKSKRRKKTTPLDEETKDAIKERHIQGMCIS